MRGSKMVAVALALLLLPVLSGISFAQEEVIDSSKPTNFYTFLENNLEYSDAPGQKVYGYREFRPYQRQVRPVLENADIYRIEHCHGENAGNGQALWCFRQA